MLFKLRQRSLDDGGQPPMSGMVGYNVNPTPRHMSNRRCRHWGCVQTATFGVRYKPSWRRRGRVPNDLGAVRDTRRFTTVRLAESFQQPCGSVLCGIRGRERPTTTQPTQTSRRSGFGAEELVDIRQAVTRRRQGGGFRSVVGAP